jgi:thiamine kinase-like enzyme
MYSIAEKPEQAKATAITFAKFTSAFSDFNVQLLKNVIPGFHDLSLRYKQFEAAIKSEEFERMAKAHHIVEELKQRERYKDFYEIIIESDRLTQRVMHHDAKIANVLFSSKTRKVICLVDFDTVMPGYFFSDLGDMIRSIACSEDENSTNFDNLSIRKEHYDAIITGYMEILGTKLTASEKKYIHYSGLLIIYMQALRFLSDYLNGDVYYHIDYPEHNLDRAMNQLILLQQLEEFLYKHYNFSHD